jgi:hypothetical protein
MSSALVRVEGRADVPYFHLAVMVADALRGAGVWDGLRKIVIYDVAQTFKMLHRQGVDSLRQGYQFHQDSDTELAILADSREQHVEADGEILWA